MTTPPPPIVPGRPIHPPTPPWQQQPTPPWQQQPTPPKSSNKTLYVVLASITAAVVLFIVGFNLLSSWMRSAKDPADKPGTSYTLTVVGCSGSDGLFSADYHIRNNTDRKRDFVVKIEWTNNGSRVATDTDFILNLAPGQTSIEKATAFGAETPPTRCDLSVR